MTAELQNHQEEAKFVLKFSHNVIEHLGLKLYQNKPTNVIAELVSNSWDADAKNVWIDLHTNSSGGPTAIVVTDNGSGMSAGVLKENYLIVGKQKRTRNDPNELSPGGRKQMGRKGIGKLAPFGVARIVDLVTVQNKLVTWLRFDYAEIVKNESDGISLAEYEPEVLAFNRTIDDIISSDASDKLIKDSLSRLQEVGKGTIVYAHSLTLRRSISPDQMLESLGRRFTVTLARPDFIVSVNKTVIAEEHVFPEWELRIPEAGSLTASVETPAGIKEIKYWAGFVKEATWPSEQAGVGIYAHGKIAQDRAFFFGNKGNEISSRYLYAVVEADWIDELENDAISTDRTSVDWENEAFTDLYKWGGTNVRAWIKAYQEKRKETATAENSTLVDKVLNNNNSYNLRPAEREHLVDLLSDVTPHLGKEASNKEKLVEATAKAWIHEPARRLIKRLWEEAALFDADKFSLIVDRLSEQLVPESLSLAVVFSQRVYALTELDKHIMLGKETQLQNLIEQFPWILDNSFEKFIPRRALTTICIEAEKNGLIPSRHVHTVAGGDTKPDFVFLGDADDKEILIIELKGPDAAAGWAEDEQLNSYMRYLQSRFTNAIVKGILVAGSFDPNLAKLQSKGSTYLQWKEVLLRSRRDHMELLAALLAGTEADKQDARVQQICELGGKPVESFLIAMSKNTPQLAELTKKTP
jgi:hypothetical protein